MNVEVRLPPLDELAERWNDISPHLLKSTRRAGGAYQPIDILQTAFVGRFGIWVCEVDGEIQATIVTEVKQYPRKRALEVTFGGGGNMAAWIEQAVAAMDRHAVEMKCDCIVCVGRPGWLRAWGATPTGDIVMVREVTTNG